MNRTAGSEIVVVMAVVLLVLGFIMIAVKQFV
jgi:hypothetical protein